MTIPAQVCVTAPVRANSRTALTVEQLASGLVSIESANDMMTFQIVLADSHLEQLAKQLTKIARQAKRHNQGMTIVSEPIEATA